MLVFNHKKYAKNDKEFIATLFCSDGTANGYYKQKPQGIYLYNIQHKLIAFIKTETYEDSAFIVSAFKDETTNNRTRYMYSTTTKTEKYLGIDNLGHMALHEECKNVFKRLNNE